MSEPGVIEIIGLGLDELPGERVRSAGFVAGGERHLAGLGPGSFERFVIRGNLEELATELERRRFGQRCVVLASGDPLFFGIGSFLSGRFGPEAVRVEPALSSMQLAFARAGLSWQEAALASIHGRDPRRTLLPLLGRCRIGLFTADGAGPRQAADFLIRHGLGDYRAVVGERLGGRDERITRWPELRPLLGETFAPLNYLILDRDPSPEVEARRALAPGIPDQLFARPETGPEVMTRQEIRAVLLSKLGRLDAGDLAWDIGAGLGTVAVEMAIARPGVEVLAIEADPARAALARTNRERFGTHAIRVIEGTAPGALADEPGRPRLAFIGGSGPHLEAILELVGERLAPGGRLLASLVTLEKLSALQTWLRGRCWPFRITHVQAARSDALGGLTGLKPLRGVFLLDADRPGGE